MSKVIVGLGNPEQKHKNTRHNVGFLILDSLVGESNFKFEKKFNAQIAKKESSFFIKPQTYMNRSGEAVSKFVSYHNVDLHNLVVIHDDVDLDFGVVKKQISASSAGHKGVQNIIDSLGSNNFFRIRVGVGRPTTKDMGTEDWVLSSFSDGQLKEITSVVTQEMI